MSDERTEVQNQFLSNLRLVSPRALHEDNVSLSAILTFARRYIRTILGSILVFLCLGALYAYSATPLFTAQELLLVDMATSRQFDLQPNGMRDVTIDNPIIESQIEIIRSGSNLTDVARRLELWKDPDFERSTSPIAELSRSIMDNIGGSNRMLSLRDTLTSIIGPARQLSDDEKLQRAVETLQRRLTVRSVKASHVIEIALEDRNGDKAARIVNSIGDTYLRTLLSDRSNAAQKATEWLDSHLIALRRRVLTATQDVLNYSAAHNLTVGGNQVPLDRQQFAELNSQLTSAKVAIAQAQAKGNRTEYEFATTRVRAIEQMLRKSIEDSTTSLQAWAHLQELQAIADSERTVFERVIQQYAGAAQEQSFPIADARVITPASQPLERSSPKSLLVIALSTLVGSITGLGLATLRSHRDRSLRYPAQVTFNLDKPYLGALPVLPRRSLLLSRSASKTPPYQEAVDNPRSSFTHNLRRIKVAVEISRAQRRQQSIGLISLQPDEGKSVLASNLAYLYALSGKPTLLIDADLHRASLTRALGGFAKAGLPEALMGRDYPCIVKKYIHDDFFDFLSAGASVPVDNSADMLGSSAMAQLLKNFRSKYELVLLDLPPLLATADAHAVSPFLDGVIIVVEHARTSADELEEALRCFDGTGCFIVGIVINKVEPRVLNREFGYVEGYH